MAHGVAIFNIEIYLFALLCIVVISGSLLYVVESQVPGSSFASIPAGMWWAVVTITTVGYGDLVPFTVVGRIIAALTMLPGLIMFALLVAVMGRTMQTVLFGSPIDESHRR
ncbi:MAG TPA: potassium channel family protein [Candidatus Paceibacterota bacterium]|nr:potassium channel family protein [Candidatus Paceibacterota bacterium]